MAHKDSSEQLNSYQISLSPKSRSAVSISLAPPKTKEQSQPKQKPIPTHRITFAELFDENFIPDLELLKVHLKKEGRLEEDCVLETLQIARGILRQEETVLELEPPVIICGDIHGQYYDLLRLFDIGGPLGESDDPLRKYLFLGDFVDRGMFGIECVLLLFTMKIAFPDHLFLLRGNHECRHLTRFFSFKAECLAKYSLAVYDSCMETFDCLPLAAVVNNQFFCVHGGLSPRIQTLEEVKNIDRFQEPNRQGDAMTDLLWSDPVPNYGFEDPMEDLEFFSFNEARKIAFFFTYQAVCTFLQDNDLLSVIRGHEAKAAGYQMYKRSNFSKFPSLITVFSAPNYCDTYGNKGVLLSYDGATLNIKTFTYSYHPYWLPNFQDGISWSLPFAGRMMTSMLQTLCKICTQEEISDSEPEVINDEEKKQRLLKKIRALGKVSKYYKKAAEHNALVAKLNGLSGNNRVPKGITGKNRKSVTAERLQNQRRLSFKEAKEVDAENETMPASSDIDANKGAEDEDAEGTLKNEAEAAENDEQGNEENIDDENGEKGNNKSKNGEENEEINEEDFDDIKEVVQTNAPNEELVSETANEEREDDEVIEESESGEIVATEDTGSDNKPDEDASDESLADESSDEEGEEVIVIEEIDSNEFVASESTESDNDVTAGNEEGTTEKVESGEANSDDLQIDLTSDVEESGSDESNPLSDSSSSA